MFFAIRLRRLDEIAERLLGPPLVWLGLEHLQINGLYLVFFLLVVIFYTLTIVGHLKARRMREGGIAITKEREEFLVWVTLTSFTITIVAAIFGVLAMLGVK